jgi:hypothetical protein
MLVLSLHLDMMLKRRNVPGYWRKESRRAGNITSLNFRAVTLADTLRDTACKKQASLPEVALTRSHIIPMHYIKTTSVLLLLFCSLACFSQKRSFSLAITYMEPYCGGARPTKEMEEEAQKAKPYIKKTIIVVSESGKIDSAKTDDSGILKLKLSVGKYKLFDAWRYYKQVPSGFSMKDMNAECLTLEWQKEIFSLNIGHKNMDSHPKNKIVLYCPWATPCLLESARPAMPQ